MKWTEAQKRVKDAAEAQLQDKAWFKGICLDNFPTDDEAKENFEDAVAQVVVETKYWDNPAV